MKTRKATIYTGKTFNVPQCIQRIDHRATHGWQLRYGGTKMFSDGAAGAADSLKRATQELCERIAKLPAPSLLQTKPSRNKSTDLPVGISGPVLRYRAGSKSQQASLTVSLPQFGAKPKGRTVYIGTQTTYTAQRYERAVQKAIRLRNAAEEQYRIDATNARRAGAHAHKQKQAEREGALKKARATRTARKAAASRAARR
jgi:hypothetical protein